MAIKFLNTATAATQAAGDNSTKIATTAYADAAAAAIPIGNYLPLSAGASKPLTGSLYIPNYIYHAGDAGTFIGFPSNDRLIIGTNGGTRVDITNSGFCLGDSGSNISVSTILDEDDMASDSATALVTQQSIKAYVDAQTPGAGVFLPLAGGTMTGNVVFPGEEANSFKIAFTGASASSGLSTVDQSGAGLYIGANSRVNTSGAVVFHDTSLPSSGIYFDGWSGDDMEFYTGSSGNPTKRLSINDGGTVEVYGTLDTSILNVNGVDQNNVNRYGNLQSEVGFTRSPITGNPNQWFKVVALGGAPTRLKFSIISTGDNTNSYDNFLISTSGYGMNMHIQKLPGGRYNTSKLLSVAAINPSNSGSVEIWIKLGPVSSGTGVTYVACTADVIASATILASATTTAPTLTSNDTQLDISGDNRNHATIQTSRGATFGAKVGIGTNAPSAMLTVAGETTMTGKVGIGITNLSADVGLYVQKAAGTVIKSETTTTNGNPDVHIVDADNANNRASLQVQGNNGAIESLFVASNGSVGIGTTSPDYKLEVIGGDIRTQDTTGSNGVLRIRSTITGTPSTGGYPNVGAGDAVIEGGGTTQRQAGVITLMNGDSSISAGQDLGVIQFVGKDDQANGYCTSQIISTTSSIMGTGASGGGILRFLTSPGNTGAAVEERMRINNSGRVMIGTTTSTSNANLTVKESLAIQSGSSTVLSISTGYGSSFINTGTSGGTVRFGAPTSYTTNVYVQGTIEAVSSVQMGNNSAAASAANAGSTRYRVSGNNSYMDMSMRTGATTYAWVNIVQNNW